MMVRRRIDDYLARGEGRKIESYDSIYVERQILEVAKNILDELKNLKDKVNAIEAVLEDLNSRMISIEERIERLGKYRSQGYIREKRSSLRDTILRILDKEMYITASEAKQKIGVTFTRILSEVQSIGNINVIDAGGEAVIISTDRFEEFKHMLESIRTGDPQEAGERLGVYKTLFNLMRRSGMIYYDVKAKAWKILS
ncbi:MAG: hypothetical protein GSR85_06000 [Desulfurococcales archaeon]|nr:hypothetical protein [Desulfurococcales archaeon]